MGDDLLGHHRAALTVGSLIDLDSVDAVVWEPPGEGGLEEGNAGVAKGEEHIGLDREELLQVFQDRSRGVEADTFTAS